MTIKLETTNPIITLNKEAISEILSDYLNLNRAGNSMNAKNIHFKWNHHIDSNGEAVFDNLEIKFTK